MINLQRSNSSNPDFVKLVAELDNYLAVCDGEEHAFYNQYNHIENLNHVVLAYVNGKAVGCGAFKALDTVSVEIKRMYVHPEGRRQGVAAKVLAELEQWAAEKGYTKSILETGKKQIEAIDFYPAQGYMTIPNYGPYQGKENSVCFQKEL